MRAVLLAPGYHQEFLPLIEERPLSLLNLLDKPLLDYQLEFLAEQGFKKVELLLFHLPHLVEGYVESGERWGLAIRSHLMKTAASAPLLLSILAESWEEEPVLLGSEELLPQVDLMPGRRLAAKSKKPLFYMAANGWSGWAHLPKSALERSFSKDSSLYEELSRGEHLKANAHPLIELSSLNSLLEANLSLLCNPSKLPSFHLGMEGPLPKTWIARTARIDPSAQLIPPLFIGEHSRVEREARIGPGAVIENHCLIDCGTHIAHSLLLQKSYVGPHLYLKSSIVDRTSLISLKHQARVQIGEEFLLSELSAPLKSPFFALLERGIALLLLLLLSPLAALAASRRYLHRIEIVKAPGSGTETAALPLFTKERTPPKEIPSGFLNCLPLLWSLAKGELSFAGIKPKSLEEFQGLSSERKKLYLRCKTGLITLEEIEHGTGADEDERYASEAYYAAHRGPLFDAKLLLKSILLKCKQLILHKK